MGLQEKRFSVEDVTYRFKKSKAPTHRWMLFRGVLDTYTMPYAMRWKLLKDGMSKAEAERMYKLLKGG